MNSILDESRQLRAIYLHRVLNELSLQTYTPHRAITEIGTLSQLFEIPLEESTSEPLNRLTILTATLWELLPEAEVYQVIDPDDGKIMFSWRPCDQSLDPGDSLKGTNRFSTITEVVDSLKLNGFRFSGTFIFLTQAEKARTYNILLRNYRISQFFRWVSILGLMLIWNTMQGALSLLMLVLIILTAYFVLDGYFEFLGPVRKPRKEID